MKKLAILIFCNLIISACASNYHYQSEQNPQKWEGKNISAVLKQWGTPDMTYQTTNKTSYYIYTSTAGRNFFNATSTNFSLLETGEDFPLRGREGLKCTAIFKTDQNNTIISTSHSGSDCGGEWAPNHS